MASTRGDYVEAGRANILTLAAQGYTIKEIADRLCRGVDTVKFHRRNLFDKLGTDNITGAVAFATNYGLLKKQ